MTWCGTNLYNSYGYGASNGAFNNYNPYIPINSVNPYNYSPPFGFYNTGAVNPALSGSLGNLGIQVGNIGPQGAGNVNFTGIRYSQESGVARFFRSLAGFVGLYLSNNILTGSN